MVELNYIVFVVELCDEKWLKTYLFKVCRVSLLMPKMYESNTMLGITLNWRKPMSLVNSFFLFSLERTNMRRELIELDKIEFILSQSKSNLLRYVLFMKLNIALQYNKIILSIF